MDQEQTLKDILEIVKFTQDNMATKQDLENYVTKSEFYNESKKIRSDIETMKSEVMTHLDGFVGLYQKLDIEVVATRAQNERLESYIEQLATHAQVTLRD